MITRTLKKMNYLSICSLVAFDNPHEAEEWYRYHLEIGVEKFYLVDDGEIDLKEVFDEKHIQFMEKEEADSAFQLRMVHRALCDFRTTTKWCSFTDSDEFLFCEKGDFQAYLQEMEEFNSVELKMRCFSPPRSYKLGDSILKTFKKYNKSTLTKCVVNLEENHKRYGTSLKGTDFNIHNVTDDGVDAKGVPSQRQNAFEHLHLRTKELIQDYHTQPACYHHYPVRSVEQLKRRIFSVTDQINKGLWPKDVTVENRIGTILAQFWDTINGCEEFDLEKEYPDLYKRLI